MQFCVLDSLHLYLNLHLELGALGAERRAVGS